MNSWSFTGNLGGDAESRFTPKGEAVVSFSVAVKSGFGDKATTTWARCQLWGKRGESVAPYLTKGQLVGVVGELTVQSYQDKQGQTKTSVDVRVNDLTLLGKKDQTSGAGKPYNTGPENAAAVQSSRQAAPPASGTFEDDIPFAYIARGIAGHSI
jgi:single-strand DNA-binding protein